MNELFSFYIKNKRESLGLSKAELGRRVGVNHTTIFRWENGTLQDLTLTNLIKLAKGLGVTPMDLAEVAWKGSNEPSTAYEEVIWHREG